MRSRLSRTPGRKRGGGGARAFAGSRGHGERQRHQEHHDRVVVRAADREHQQDGIQADERRGPARTVPEAAGRAGDEGDRREAREPHHGFQDPEPAGGSQRRGRVAGDGEQRPVWRVQEGPSDELVDGVERRFRRDPGVRIEAVQRTHPRERQVAEDIL
jgi:hypothetical protein